MIEFRQLFALVILAGGLLVFDETRAQVQSDRLRIEISPVQRALLAGELAGSIARFDYRPGDSFEKGDLLLRFDCRVYQAQLNKARAARDAAARIATSMQRLFDLDGASNLDYNKAMAELTIAEAEVALAEATVSKCDISAPFSGRVAARHVENHEFVKIGDPLVEIYDSSRLEIRFIAPSAWLPRLKVGTRVDVTVDETGEAYPAFITRLGAVVDPLSQSIEVYAEFRDGIEALLPGMSGWASIVTSDGP